VNTRKHCAALAVVLVAALRPADALAAGGTISGTVEVVPAKYLEETVVFLKAVPGNYAPRTFTMDQRGMKFAPRILLVTKGDTVRFLNHDAVAHNVYSPDQETYNLGVFEHAQERAHQFTAEGIYAQLCSVHPEMLGYVFVGQNPFSSTVDAKGHYAIRDVPPGTYQLAVWNAHMKGSEKAVTVAPGVSIAQDLVVRR